MNPDKKKQANNQLMKYAGMGFQFLLSIGLALYVGLKTDEWLKISFPLLVWLLPLLIIVGLIIKLVIETGKK
jgi:hypothetical protein